MKLIRSLTDKIGQIKVTREETQETTVRRVLGQTEIWTLNSGFYHLIFFMITTITTITLIIFMFINRIITMIIFRFLRARSGAKTIYNLTTTALLVVFINVPFPIYNGSFEKVLFYRKALDLYKLQCTINICVCCLFLENLYMCCCRIETYFWRTNKT